MKKTFYILLLFGLTIFTAGCVTETEPSLYNPDYESGPQPVINEMIPADSTLAGVGTITVRGDHFAPVEPFNDYNQIFFDALKAQIVSVTETEMVIKTPSLIREDINVKVAVRGSDLFSEIVKYKLRAAVDTTFGRLDDFPQQHLAYGIAADNNSNVYLSCELQVSPKFGRILKIGANGEPATYIDKTSFLKATAMKFGPDDLLYVAIVAGRLKQIKTIDAAGTETIYASLSTNPSDLDFDANGNIWVVGQGNLYRVKPDKSVETVQSYSVDLKSVRVYNDQLYIVGGNNDLSEQKIYQYDIDTDGNLSNENIVLDATEFDELSAVTINALTFSADGIMYIATNGTPDALFEFDEMSNSLNVLYPGLIRGSITNLSWGSGNYLFAVQYYPESAESNILQIDLEKSGAPYWGRQ